MDNYITGTVIRQLRERRGLTQSDLAESIGVTPKTVSKWETARGFPDISLIEPLAQALGVSIIELMTGDQIRNSNVSSNLLRSRFYVCPVCGNVIHTTGDTLVCCCGITLPPLEAEEPDEDHQLEITNVEDEQFITVKHPMTKAHYLSFFAYVTTDSIQLVKLYPESNPETRFRLRGRGVLYLYCNRHGLMKQPLHRAGSPAPVNPG